MILAEDIIDTAARQITDPKRGQVDAALWLDYVNDAQLWITRRFKVIEQDATFDWINDERYPWPSDMAACHRVAFSLTPSDRSSWREVREKPEAEAREYVRYHYPTAAEPRFYWPRTSFFQVVPMPTATLLQCGQISYWRIAKRVADPTTEYLEVPDHMRLSMSDLVRAYAKRDLRRIEESDREFARIENDIAQYAQRIEDRTEDAPKRFVTGASTPRLR